MTFYWILQVWVGLLLFGVGIPFRLGKIPPNPWAGARTPKTLGNAAVWYPANRVLGLDLMLLGGLLLGSTAVTFALRATVPFAQLAMAHTVVTLAGVTLLVVHTLRTISRL